MGFWGGVLLTIFIGFVLGLIVRLVDKQHG